MNNRISLDNVFNYISSAIRKAQNDDDQLKSWAMQGFRKFKFRNMQYVKDVIALDVKNHKVKLPTIIKDIIVIDFLDNENVAVYEQFIADYPEWDITYLSKVVYRDIFYSLKEVSPQAFNYYCKVEDNKNIYTFTDEPDVIQMPFSEGTVLIQFWREYSDGDDILIPEEPESLWVYLGAFIKMKHWEERKDYKEQGAGREYQDAQMEVHNYFDSCKRELVWSNFSIENAKKTMYGQSYIMHLYPKLIEYYKYVKF